MRISKHISSSNNDYFGLKCISFITVETMYGNFNCFVPYLLIDLPTIVSGNKIAYLEPHEEIRKGESGRCYKISDCVHNADTLSPFEGLCGFSSSVIPYNATLFRFPLRNVKKQNRVSLNTYDIGKLHKFLTALRKEAKLFYSSFALLQR